MAYSQDWIFKKEFLENVNSVRFSQSTDIRKEKENRFKTVWFIKDLSNALRPGPAVEIPRDRKDEEADYDIRNLKVLWTACAFFHRFYVFHSFGTHQRFAVAVACLFLASKVEEKPLRLSDHIFMYFRLRKNEIVKKTDPQFKDMEKEVLLSERILLQTLGFDLNVVHPYQFFRQIIGKDLKAWFADPEDSKQVLRLATNLLTDSYRSTLCLLYTPQQLAVGLVFLALQIIGLKPQAPVTSNGMYGSRPGYSPATVTQDGSSDQSWLELLEKDAEESVVRDICFTMVELYETSFSPADVPYTGSKAPTHAELRKGIATELDRVASMRVTAAEREGVEEHKGSVLADDLVAKAGNEPSDGSGSSSNGSSNKRKLSIDGVGMTTSGLGSITKSRYTTLPPAFSDATTTVASGSASKVLFPSGAAGPALSVSVVAGAQAGGASPCVNAPTPRGYRPVCVPSNVSPDSLPLPPPDSPGSAYSTFSQANAHLHEHQYKPVSGPEAAADKDDSYERLLNGSGLESPDFMPPPPPPDTPGSMASTPNFENLPRAGEFGHHLPDQFSLQHSKRPRMDY